MGTAESASGLGRRHHHAIPKKGDLTCCDNWRGIALLEVVGKVLATVLQQRLQMVVEEVLPESQCGFRVGRGCSDMIFTVRQLLEKSYEHRGKIFLVFVDLKKAYDSVPRAALWRALEKLGIPSSVVSLIQSFHDGMKAQVRVSGALLEDIDVENGLQQGCSLAPVQSLCSSGGGEMEGRAGGKTGCGSTYGVQAG